MNSSFIGTVKRAIQSGLGRLGYAITTPEQARPPLFHFFDTLKRHGFSPKHVMDVGAHMGGWTRCAIEYFPDARYTLIEPQGSLRVHVQDLLERTNTIEWITAGVSDVPGTLDFTIDPRADSCSFVPTQQEARVAGLRQIKVAVTTLDEVIEARQLPLPELVKIDAEGFDLRVVKGGSRLVHATEVFVLEAAVVADGFPNSVAAVLRTMDDFGYCLIDIPGLNRSPKHGVLWLCDLAFLKKGSGLLRAVTSYE